MMRIFLSASIAENPLLYVRPSSWCFELKLYVQRSRVCPGSVGTSQTLLQGWLLCVGFVCLANVPDLVRRPYVISIPERLLCNQELLLVLQSFYYFFLFVF